VVTNGVNSRRATSGDMPGPLSDTATMLGFSGLAVFSRWHRLQYGAAASSARSVSRDQTPSGGAL
jgi:hypothetical protein